MHLGWSKNFFPEVLAQVDYVLMDPQTIPLGNREFMRIWEFNTYEQFRSKMQEGVRRGGAKGELEWGSPGSRRYNDEAGFAAVKRGQFDW